MRPAAFHSCMRGKVEAWRESEQSAREVKELEECTFEPRLLTRKKKGGPDSNNKAHNPDPSSRAEKRPVAGERAAGSGAANGASKGTQGGGPKPVVVRGLGRYLEVKTSLASGLLTTRSKGPSFESPKDLPSPRHHLTHLALKLPLNCSGK